MPRRAVFVIALSSACSFHGSGEDHPVDAAIPPAVDVAIDAPDIDGAAADWWDPAWTYRRPITVDTSAVTATIEKFPVLVRLTDLAHVGTNGADLRFVAADGTVLFHDVDTFDDAGPGTRVWVSVTLAPGPMTFWVYYGNSFAQPSANAPKVWTDYTSVHHMSDLADATGNGHAGASAVTATTSTGRIGSAIVFAGTQIITLADESAYDFTAQMSLSVWFRYQTFDVDWQALVAKGDVTWRAHRSGGQPSRIAFSTSPDNTGNNNQNLESNSITTTPNWHHLGMAFRTNIKVMTIDGVPLPQTSFTGPLNTTDVAVTIGANLERPGREWKGDIDEVRISPTARSPEWLLNEYKTAMELTYAVVGPETMH